jgi:hypothetical protein
MGERWLQAGDETEIEPEGEIVNSSILQDPLWVVAACVAVAVGYVLYRMERDS